MALFRRRTDRIYATLQQVQRRITQGTEPGDGNDSQPVSFGGMSQNPSQRAKAPLPTWSAPERSGTGYVVMPDGKRHATHDDDHSSHGSSAPAEEATPPAETGASLYTQRTGTGFGGPPSSTIPTGQPANPNLDLAASEGRDRSMIELTPTVASFVFMAWVLTVAVAFFIGLSQGSPGRPDPGVAGPPVSYGSGVAPSTGGPINDPQAERQTQQTNQGNYVLVLRSWTKVTPAYEKEFSDLAAQGNDAWSKKGMDPLFGVRYTSNGQIMFVYGQVGDSFGISKNDQRAERTFAALKKAFPDLHWRELTD